MLKIPVWFSKIQLCVIYTESLGQIRHLIVPVAGWLSSLYLLQDQRVTTVLQSGPTSPPNLSLQQTEERCPTNVPIFIDDKTKLFPCV